MPWLDRQPADHSGTREWSGRQHHLASGAGASCAVCGASPALSAVLMFHGHIRIRLKGLRSHTDPGSTSSLMRPEGETRGRLLRPPLVVRPVSLCCREDARDVSAQVRSKLLSLPFRRTKQPLPPSAMLEASLAFSLCPARDVPASKLLLRFARARGAIPRAFYQCPKYLPPTIQPV